MSQQPSATLAGGAADTIPASSSDRIGWTALLSILAALVILFLAQTTHPIVPSEDAYITFRYAANLADGQGLVWNAGEDPVEGSTEFLWVVLLAGISKLGLDIESAALALNIMFAALAVILVGLASYYLSRGQALVVLFAAGAFAAGPLSYHVRSGFATPLFTLLIITTFVAQIILVLRPQQDRLRTSAFVILPLSALLLGLTRPEGVLFGALALLVTLALLDGKDRIRLLKYTVVFLLVPGLIYFIWRWQYFGYFLPNTFYVKSSGSLLHLKYFFDIYGLYRFLAPLLLLIGFGLIAARRGVAGKVLVLLLPVFLFPWAYLLIDQLQNLGQRFQYPVYPIFLLAAAGALGALTSARTRVLTMRDVGRYLPLFAGVLLALFALFVPTERVLYIELLVLAIVLLKAVDLWAAGRIDATVIKGVSIILLVAFAVFNIQQSYRLAGSFYPTRYDDRQAIGAALAPYAAKGYTIVASEAGWLPFFSKWRAIDPFGLNDEYVTHSGLSVEYLDSVQPDIIMYHQVDEPEVERWTAMTDLLREYAESHGFVLAAVIERNGPDDLHVYYVRSENEDAEALIDAITGQEPFIYSYRAP